MNTTANQIITHSQYMDNSSELHQNYYVQFATDATRQWVLKNIGLERLLKSKDKYFNDLGFKHSNNGAGSWIWDFAPYNLTTMREAGEVSSRGLPSPATITCTAKACARMLVNESKGKA
jgi:hypothetical protein